jgi:hypothetical protein
MPMTALAAALAAFKVAKNIAEAIFGEAMKGC